MKTKDLEGLIDAWIDKLVEEELSKNTIDQYKQGVTRFKKFIETKDIDEIQKKDVIEYKNDLIAQAEANTGKRAKPGSVGKVSTINLYLIALNKFFKDYKHKDLTVKTLDDISNNVIDSVITEKEYNRLITWAKRLDDDRTGMIMETLAGTGIRVSELKYLTVESLKNRTMTVTNKGKTRLVFIPKELTKKLKHYCKKHGIHTGIIFHGYKWIEENGKRRRVPDSTKLLNNTTINEDMKKIAGKARGIKLDSIHPHAFRHLFAKRYANIPGGNPYVLPMILGHSTRDVTGLYVKPSTKELKEIMDEVEAYYKPERKRKKRKRAKRSEV